MTVLVLLLLQLALRALRSQLGDSFRADNTWAAVHAFNVTNGDLCAEFRCTLIPARKVGEALACGLPFLFTLWLAYRLLTANGFRFDRQQFVSAWRIPCLHSTPFSYESRASLFNSVLKVVALLPLGCAAFWSAMVWWILHPYYLHARLPNSVALALCAFCLIVCLGSYGFLHWQAAHFRMTQTVAICFGLVVSLIVTLQLVFTIFVFDNAAPSAFVIFMSYNLAPVMLMAYLPHVRAKPITFPQMLRLSARDPKFEADSVELQIKLQRLRLFLFVLSVGALLLFALLMHYEFQSYFGWQVGVAVLYCDFACYMHTSAGLNNDPLLLHVLSLLSRGILFAGWEHHWFAAVSVNFLMFAALFVYAVVDSRHPVFTKDDALDSVVAAIESALEESRAEEQRARVEALAEADEQKELLEAKMSHQVSMRSMAHGLETAFDSVGENVQKFIPGAKELGAVGRKVAEEIEARRKALLRSPEFGLAILCLLYVAYTLLALYADLKNPSWGATMFPQVRLSNNESSAPHPQYQIGLCTALIVLAATLFFVAYRCYELSGFRWNRSVGIAGSAFLVVTIGSCVLVSLVTHSDLIYVFGIYAPLIAVVATLTYCNWRRQDYRWNGWPNYQLKVYNLAQRDAKAAADKAAELEEARKQAVVPVAAEGSHVVAVSQHAADDDDEVEHFPSKRSASSGAGGVFSSLAASGKSALSSLSHFSPLKLASLGFSSEYDCPHEWSTLPERDPRFFVLLLSDFLRGRHTSADYIIFVSVGVLAALVVALGVHLSKYIPSNPELAYFIASVVGVTIFAVFTLLKWFNTFSLGLFQILVQSGLLIYTASALHTAEGEQVITSIGVALLYPSVMCLIMAMYSWSSNGWKLSRAIRSVLGVGCSLALIWIILFIAMSGRVAVGVIGLIAFLMGMFFLSLGMVWATNDFHLPSKMMKLAIAVCASVVVASLVVIFILQKTWFTFVTVLWILSTIALLAYAVQEARVSDTRQLLPSLFIFPVYEYSPQLGNEVTIRIRNQGIIALVVVSAEAMAWGFIAALLQKPGFVGWIFFALGGLAFLLIALEALFKPLISFWRNFAIVADSPTVVDLARERALASQLGSDSDAFHDQAEEDMAGDADSNDPDAAVECKILRRLQLYWNFEEASEVELLQAERARFIAHPLVPEELDVSQREKWIAEETANYDARIAQVFEEQTRILVMFQLLINIGAQALAKQNRARVRDFLRKYFARKREVLLAREQGVEIPRRSTRVSVAAVGPGSSSVPAAAGAAAEEEDDVFDDYPLIDLTQSNAVEIREWARENTELKRKAARYIADQAASQAQAKAVQEAQRVAAMERSKVAGAALDGNVVITPVAPTRQLPVREAEKKPHSVAVQPLPTHGGGGGGGGGRTVGSGPAAPLIVANGSGASSSGGLSPKQVEVDAFQYRQRGISFAIDELNIRGPTAESVVAQARVAVANIIARHESMHKANSSSSGSKPSAAALDQTSLFSDPFFPAVADLDQLIEAGTDPADAAAKKPLSGRKTKAVWKRPHEICPNPRVFAADTLDPAAIIQGDLEDCYLLSALSVLAKDGASRIRDLFLVQEYNAYGIYGMCFFVDGEWRAVFVDDQFPYLPGQNQLAFARSKVKNEFWLPILEKCYAKLYAGYPSIIGGLVHASFQDLTGGITDEIALDTPDSGAYDGRLWSRLYSFHRMGILMGCGNPKPHAGNFTAVAGIVQGHAYAVLDLREVGEVKLIQLRNPWSEKRQPSSGESSGGGGEGEWEGDWGPRSPLWTQKMRTLCNYPETVSADGVFWMAFEDFVRNFTRIYLARVFDQIVDLNGEGQPISAPPAAISNSKAVADKSLTPSAAPASPWYRISLSGCWKGPSAAGHVCWVRKFPERRPECNPQYMLKLVGTRPSVVFLTLTQPTAVGGASYKFLSLLILSKQGLRARDVKKSELVAGNSKCRNSREICAEVSLEPGKVYTVFVSTYNPGEESTFKLTAYCRQLIQMQELGPNVKAS